MASISALVGALLMLVVSSTMAHMQLSYPAPFNASNNPYTSTAPDPYLIYPYDCCGPNDRWMYPCRGYHQLLGTPEGAPTATWAAGSSVNWSLTGNEPLGGNHYGGSCQVGFSTDLGNTFQVATSYQGNCPHRNGGVDPAGQTFNLTLPVDLPVGVQIFAWIWYNREQELNMNCAAVNITAAPPASAPASYFTARSDDSILEELGNHAHNIHRHIHPLDKRQTYPSATASPTSSTSSVAFSNRPQMLVADNGNGCLTPHTTAEVQYPDPGPDVVPGDGVYPIETPTGCCLAPDMTLAQAYNGSTGDDGHPLGT